VHIITVEMKKKRGFEFKLTRAIVPLCFLGVLILAVVGGRSAPPTVDISDLSARLDQRVSVIGIVYDIKEGGGNKPFKADIHGEAFPLSVEVISWDVEHVNICIGDVIKVTGKVSTYQGRYQVVFDSSDEVELLESNNCLIPLETLKKAPQFYVGKEIAVAGYLEEGFLKNGSISIEVKDCPDELSGNLTLKGRLIYEDWRYYFDVGGWTPI